MAATILEASASYNPAFLGAPLDPCAGPHKPPNMLDPFMTRYDYDYNKEVPPSLFALREKESGFSKNRPLFGRPPTDDWDSVEHRTYIDLRKTRGIGMIPNENELRKLFITSVEPHLLSTAYIRGQRSKVGCPHGDPTTISTYKDHYPQKWTALASGPYAGKNANTYNPNLLSIDTPEDDGVGKPVKRGRARTADGINNNNNNNIWGSLPYKRPQDNLSVFGPGSRDKLEGETEYSAIGNPTLFKKSLLPRNISHLDGDYNKDEKDKRKLLDGLAGRHKKLLLYNNINNNICPDLLDTVPIPIGLRGQEVCRVAHRLELEGPVNITNYQHDYRTQQRLPELRDNININKNNIISNNNIRIGKYGVGPERPMHPTKKLCEEKHERELGVDRHLHKYRKFDEKALLGSYPGSGSYTYYNNNNNNINNNSGNNNNRGPRPPTMED